MSQLIVHLDADSFYVAAERLAHPELQNIPVAVLSSLDAFVIARSYELKPLGVKVGTSKWDALKVAPDALFIPADFARYGKVSKQMFDVVNDISPKVEGYSIDEAFADLTGLDDYYKMTAPELGMLIKNRIRKEVGITVSVGIASTKTLAKLASDYKKPDGLFVVDETTLLPFLADRAIDDIWGIGGKRGPQLKAKGIETALDFYQLPLETVMLWMGKNGVDLWLELHGNCISPVSTESAPPKSVSRTSNFELKTTNPAVVYAALTHHAAKVVSLLVDDDLFTRRMSIFLRRKDFSFDTASEKLPYPTHNHAVIAKAIRKMFVRSFHRNVVYRGTGVITEIDPNGPFDIDLFVPYDKEKQAETVTRTITDLNRKYGKGTVKYLSTTVIPRRYKQQPDDRLGVAIIQAS